MPALTHPVPPLTDGVVLLRALAEADLPAVVEAMNDAAAQRFLSGIPAPYGDQDARDFFAETRTPSDETIHFTVADASDDDRLLGATGLHDVDWENRRAATGYWVAPWARRAGVATRALRLVTAWALEDLDLVRVWLVADVDNDASQRVAERAGFIREGVLHKHSVMGGAPRDCAAYGRVAPG